MNMYTYMCTYFVIVIVKFISKYKDTYRARRTKVTHTHTKS